MTALAKAKANPYRFIRRDAGDYIMYSSHDDQFHAIERQCSSTLDADGRVIKRTPKGWRVVGESKTYRTLKIARGLLLNSVIRGIVDGKWSQDRYHIFIEIGDVSIEMTDMTTGVFVWDYTGKLDNVDVENENIHDKVSPETFPNFTAARQYMIAALYKHFS